VFPGRVLFMQFKLSAGYKLDPRCVLPWHSSIGTPGLEQFLCVVNTTLGPAGGSHALDYNALRQRYNHVPRAALGQLLRQALANKAAADLPGLTSLLHEGERRSQFL